VIVDQQGRYFMQLRDNTLTITFSGYGTLFDDEIENEETPNK
jgi:hypothetical protein